MVHYSIYGTDRFRSAHLQPKGEIDKGTDAEAARAREFAPDGSLFVELV